QTYSKAGNQVLLDRFRNGCRAQVHAPDSLREGYVFDDELSPADERAVHADLRQVGQADLVALLDREAAQQRVQHRKFLGEVRLWMVLANGRGKCLGQILAVNVALHDEV